MVENVLGVINQAFIKWCHGLDPEAFISSADGRHYNHEAAHKFARSLLKRENLSKASSQTITDFVADLPRTYQERLLGVELFSGPNKKKLLPDIGLFITALCSYVSVPSYHIPTQPLRDKLNVTLDHLFYRFLRETSPQVTIEGPIGNLNFFRAKVEATVLGRAGQQNACGFRDGYVIFQVTGDRTAENILNGDIQIYSGGNDIALNGNGGHVKVVYAKDNLGRGNKGTSIDVLKEAGEYLCFEMEAGVVRAFCMPGPHIAESMKGGRLELNVPYGHYDLPPKKKTGGMIFINNTGMVF